MSTPVCHILRVEWNGDQMRYYSKQLLEWRLRWNIRSQTYHHSHYSPFTHQQIAGKEEFELTDMKKEDEGSSVQIFAVVNLEAGVAYAFKVGIHRQLAPNWSDGDTECMMFIPCTCNVGGHNNPHLKCHWVLPPPL